MTVVVTVLIDAPPSVVAKVESDNPDIFDKIMGPAEKYVTAHRRLLGEASVMDIDEFASMEDHDAFVAEAAEGIELYGKALGVTLTGTLWELEDTPLPDA
ncbi:MAG TPA: hypothetical protein VNT22_03090 [Baekduia sp.]|nr:hypothetical protein [Baekduia sp.]